MAAALLKRTQQQQLQQQGKIVTQVQVPTQGNPTGATVYTQAAGVQVQQAAGTSGTAGTVPVTAMVKPAVGTAVAGARTATAQQIRQVALQQQAMTPQRKLANQKPAQFAQVAKGGVVPHLILSSKAGMSTLMKFQSTGALPQFTHVSLCILSYQNFISL